MKPHPFTPRQVCRIKAKQRQRVTEASVEAEIRTLLELNGWRTHKLDVMRGVKVEYEGRGTRRFSEGTPGQPDLIAVRYSDASSLAACGPCFDVLYIECKAPDGKLEPHQQAFHEVLRRDGFTVIVARSWEELKSQAESAGVKLERNQ